MRALRWPIVIALCLAVGSFLVPRAGAHSSDDDDAPQESADDPVVLAIPVKLEFTVDEGDGIGFTVLCASDEYRTSIDHSNDDGENHIEIEGNIYPVSDDGTVLLTFDATIYHADLANGGEITFSAQGSTVIKLGEKKVLATSPGPGFSVTMHRADD